MPLYIFKCNGAAAQMLRYCFTDGIGSESDFWIIHCRRVNECGLRMKKVYSFII